MPAAHIGASGSHVSKHSARTPSWVIEHACSDAAHSGLSSEPVHMATHVPSLVRGSTKKHIAPSSQLSMPLVPEPSTVQGSPGASASRSIGEQRVAVHELPPSLAHGMHFSPAGQSCAKMSHSKSMPPPSGRHP